LGHIHGVKVVMRIFVLIFKIVNLK